MTLTDSSKDGVVTKGEWDATLAFLRSNEDNVLAIRPGGSGDSNNSHVAWKASRGISEMPSPLFYRGQLYFVRNGGTVTSYAPDSGRVVLDRQRLGTLGQYVASPVAADGRTYAASETGTIVVFRAGDTWKCWRATLSARASRRRRPSPTTSCTSELQNTSGHSDPRDASKGTIIAPH